MVDKEYFLQCKDSIGGVKNVYIFSYEKHARKDYRVLNNNLMTYPQTIIYNFRGLKNASYSETGNISNTGDSFSQTLNINFSKIGELYHFENLIKKRLRAIVEDNNGKFWILGLENGLTTSAYTKQTGASKTELNGYNITLSGMERLEAPYFDSLEPTFEVFRTLEWIYLDNTPFTNFNGEQLHFIN